MGISKQGEGPRVEGRQVKAAIPKNEFYNGLFERGRFDKDLGISKKCFVGRQLFWGPICEWFSPFWATFKLFSKKVVRNIQQN